MIRAFPWSADGKTATPQVFPDDGYTPFLAIPKSYAASLNCKLTLVCLLRHQGCYIFTQYVGGLSK